MSLASLTLVALGAQSACSSAEAGNPSSSSGGSGPPVGQAGSPNGAGVANAGSSGGGAGGMAGAGVVAGNANTAGGGGTPGGSGGSAGSAGTGGAGLEPGDTPPWRALMVTAALEEHVHGQAGMDARAKSLGKLAVDIGVNSGSYVSWLAKRGYHAMGAPCGDCPAPNLGAGRDEVGNCRLEEFETTANAVKTTLTNLHAQFPEEDWGYFLNQDGSVRWSDVAITGISHGATTAAIAGRVAERMWRVVSRSGPRDNTCGAAGGTCSVPLTTPSYDVACPDSEVASWLDQPSKTPMNRFFGIVGTGDVQCGDIMFNMFRTKYVGVPTVFNEPGAILEGQTQFFSTEGGHLDFLRAANLPMNTEAVLNLAFGIPPENQNPAF
jgi:hypothetical protein